MDPDLRLSLSFLTRSDALWAAAEAAVKDGLARCHARASRVRWPVSLEAFGHRASLHPHCNEPDSAAQRRSHAAHRDRPAPPPSLSSSDGGVYAGFCNGRPDQETQLSRPTWRSSCTQLFLLRYSGIRDEGAARFRRSVARQRFVGSNRRRSGAGGARIGAARRRTNSRDCQQPVGKTTEAGGPCDYNAGKKVKCRKRRIAGDTLGLPIVCQVTNADAQDCAALPDLMHAVNRRLP